MPSKRRVSVPETRVYRSARPTRQTKLPELEKRVRRSYGKKGGPKVGKPDDTLTQMGYVTVSPLYQSEGEEEDVDIEAEKRGKKRRKTLGDSPAPQQYHTQTISQMVSSFHSDFDDNSEKLVAPNEDEDVIYGIPCSSQSVRGPHLISERSPRVGTGRRVSPRHAPASKKDLSLPQTPRRTFRQEIPSSESPATPINIYSIHSASRSPLREVSLNTPIPFIVNRSHQGKLPIPPKLEVQDTFYTATTGSSTQSLVQSSPARRSSVAKSVRFAIPIQENEEEEEEEEGTTIVSPILEGHSTQRMPSQASHRRRLENEILDSDAESDDESECQVEELEEMIGFQSQRHGEQEQRPSEPQELSKPRSVEEDPETCYGEIDGETQIEVGKALNFASIAADVEKPEAVLESTFQECSQMMESQRLSTQHVDAMAPRTLTSDVFVSVHPTRLADIIRRKRDHETRQWPIRASRIWLYETSPASTLRYMAVIGDAKRPGQIADESGKGNAEFNAEESSKWYAYEILELYELANPLSISELISNEWLESPPKKTKPVLPVVLDQLMANLKPPLFRKKNEETPSFSMTDTQEAEAQLMSTIRQFTQLQQSSQPFSGEAFKPYKDNTIKSVSSNPSIDVIEELAPSSQIITSDSPDLDSTIPSSQQDLPIMVASKLPASSQATTVDLTQSSDVIFDSPKRPLPSSTPVRLPTLHSGVSTDSLGPFSMTSSQLLTKSQMLPESLLGESVPGPPPYVGDSDEEDDELSVEL